MIHISDHLLLLLLCGKDTQLVEPEPSAMQLHNIMIFDSKYRPSLTDNIILNTFPLPHTSRSLFCDGIDSYFMFCMFNTDKLFTGVTHPDKSSSFCFVSVLFFISALCSSLLSSVSLLLPHWPTFPTIQTWIGYGTYTMCNLWCCVATQHGVCL